MAFQAFKEGDTVSVVGGRGDVHEVKAYRHPNSYLLTNGVWYGFSQLYVAKELGPTDIKIKYEVDGAIFDNFKEAEEHQIKVNLWYELVKEFPGEIPEGIIEYLVKNKKTIISILGK